MTTHTAPAGSGHEAEAEAEVEAEVEAEAEVDGGLAAESTRPPARRRLVIAVSAGISAVALANLVTASVVLETGADARIPHLSATEESAAGAARTLLADLTTYGRASFDVDWQRAVASTTGALRSQELAARASVLAQLNKSGHDVRGTVVAVGVRSAKGDSASLDVVLDGYSVTTKQSTLTSTNRLQVTLKKVGGRWLISSLSNVALV